MKKMSVRKTHHFFYERTPTGFGLTVRIVAKVTSPRMRVFVTNKLHTPEAVDHEIAALTSALDRVGKLAKKSAAQCIGQKEESPNPLIPSALGWLGANIW